MTTKELTFAIYSFFSWRKTCLLKKGETVKRSTNYIRFGRETNAVWLFLNYDCVGLRVSVPFIQIKKLEKHPWRSVAFSRVAG